MENFNLKLGSMALSLVYGICTVLLIFYAVKPKDDRRRYADGLTMSCMVCSICTIVLVANNIDMSSDPLKGAMFLIDCVMTIGTIIGMIVLSKKDRTEHDNNALAVLSLILFIINCYIITTF